MILFIISFLTGGVHYADRGSHRDFSSTTMYRIMMHNIIINAT